MLMKSRSFIIFSCALLMLMPAQAMTDRGATTELFSELVECVAYFSVVTDASKHVMIGDVGVEAMVIATKYSRMGSQMAGFATQVGVNNGMAREDVSRKIKQEIATFLAVFAQADAMVSRYQTFCLDLYKDHSTRLIELKAGEVCDQGYRCW
jgi:hypothetical protein